MFFRACVVALVGVSCNAASAVAFEALEAERPFVTTTNQILGHGVYQLEQGASYVTGATGAVSFPSRHRLGVGSDVELLIETPIVTLSGGQVRMADLSVGGKWRFAEGGGWGEVPSLGLVALATVGEEGQLAPHLLAAIDTTLPGALKIGANLGAYLATDASAWLRYSAALAWCPVERLKVCAELLGDSPVATGEQQMGVDCGLGWILDPSTQVDMLLYKGVTSQAPEWSCSVGLSTRWGM